MSREKRERGSSEHYKEELFPHTFRGPCISRQKPRV